MKCYKCGADNYNNYKFCTSCGSELTKENIIQEIICETCGSKSKPGNNYCTNCGDRLEIEKNIKVENSHALQHQKQKKTSNQKTNRPHKIKKNYENNQGKALGLKPVLITIAIIFFSFLAITIYKTQLDGGASETLPLELKSENLVIEAKVYDIASKFVCSCGTCGEEALETCKCGRAIEERNFVREYLELDWKTEDIIIALANRYGYLRSEFANTYNVDKSKIWTANSLQSPSNSKSIAMPDELRRLATIADVTNIYSKFRCPCSQCGMDELKECSCAHPNGAIDVKRFVDDRLRENKYTVNEIIDLVQAKYSGRKS